MLFIPFSDYEYIGGPGTFMKNLKFFLDRNNFLYDSSFKSDGIFFPISYNVKTLKLIKKEKGKIIQRLDGIYYPSKHGKKYVKINKNIKAIYLKYSDYIIFQSEYSKKQCFELFGEKDAINYSLIINGVNKKIFFSSKNTKQDDQIQFITTGNFRNLDMLEPVIFSLDSLKEKFDFKLHVVGSIVNNLLKPLLNRDYVVEHGLKNMEEISSLLQVSDIFIYSHLNPPCPNSVVEAISCGLPIVGFNSGAMSELCFFSKDLFAYVSEDVFQKYEDFKTIALTEKIELCINNYEYYKNIAMENAHLYSFEECGKKYVDVFNKVLREE